MTLRRRDALLAAGSACLAGSAAPAANVMPAPAADVMPAPAAGVMLGVMPGVMPGAMMGADAALGHRLRMGDFPEPVAVDTAAVVIVGGGVAGLSAAWRLRRRGVDGVTLVEMERAVGGNASSGRNPVSAYPWGRTTSRC